MGLDQLGPCIALTQGWGCDKPDSASENSHLSMFDSDLAAAHLLSICRLFAWLRHLDTFLWLTFSLTLLLFAGAKPLPSPRVDHHKQRMALCRP